MKLVLGRVPARAKMLRLTSASITDSNERREVVKLVEQQIADFADGYAATLPAFSLTVLTWRTQ